MRADLSEEQWLGPEQRQLTGPDRRRFTRRTTRAKRQEVDKLIADGAPLILYYWGGGTLDWFDGADAQTEWQAVRSAVTAQPPVRTSDLQWTAGRWEDDDGRPLVLLTGHC
ncbi:hypothetical protein [Blastococcus sp. TF02-09]|uniref:hypothetical protein n=1 Tax=Blastococcus sp. TF02-09 TaxID=2250576 RepID=UPI0011BDE6F9|nr:hypothetical protein [Blastococcus sp. TF02-9]